MVRTCTIFHHEDPEIPISQVAQLKITLKMSDRLPASILNQKVTKDDEDRQMIMCDADLHHQTMTIVKRVIEDEEMTGARPPLGDSVVRCEVEGISRQALNNTQEREV